jgi:hypothetical protein
MAEYDNEANGEFQEFDTIAASVSAVYLDNRKYYWPNYDPVEVHHEKYKFVYSIPATATAINQSGSFYVATFTESLLLTWVGMEAKIHRRIGASTYILVNVVEGSNPFSDITNPYLSSHVPPRVRVQEPLNIHLMTTDDRIDFGKRVHHRVHSDFSLEVTVRIGSDVFNAVAIRDLVVAIKVQTSAAVGGPRDHPLWNQTDYERSKSPKLSGVQKDA